MNKIFGEPVYRSNFEKYETMLTDISQESGRIAWSSGNSTLFYMILLVIIVTIAACVFFPFANMLIMLFIFAAEGIGLVIPVLLYHRKAGNYMQEQCLEFDRTHPGLYDAFEEWKQKEREKLPDYSG